MSATYKRADHSKPGATLSAAAVTAGYVELLSATPGRGVIVQIANSLDSDTWISLDGGTTNYVQLPAGVGLSIDFGANGVEFSGTVSVKQGSAASTTGFISAGVVRSK